MKAASLSRRILLTLAAGITGTAFAFAGTVGAATSQSYQISPPTANYVGDHGTTQRGTIKVTNLTGAPLSVKTGKENFVAKGEEGEIELVDEADPLYSLAPWFSLDAAQLDVPAFGTKELHYTVTVPADAEPGGRYGSIVFSTIPPKLPSGESGASVQQTIASIVFMRINGHANEQLEVASFGPEKGFYETGPVKLLTRLKNTGTVHEKATGTITIKNMLGFKVASFPLDEHFVIPGAVRRLHNDWPDAKHPAFLLGRYTVQLDAKYGDGKTLTASSSFTVIPWKQLAVVLIILILVFLLFWRGRKRLRRAVRILAGRE
jgi:hypothetical protein